MTGPVLYLEDLTPGQIFESRSHTLIAAEIKEFAAPFDPQFFHLDEEAAKTFNQLGEIVQTMASRMVVPRRTAA